MKKNNKINKIIILTVIALIFTISLVIFILNYTKDSSSFSILEKNWINSHDNSVIDISVYNDVPIYGQNGEGLIFSYLDEFTNSYGIEFNKVSYLTGGNTNLKNVSFRILNFNDKITDNDIEIYKDYYVILSKENNQINDINHLTEASLGALDNDINNVRYYLNDGNNLKFISCKDLDEMLDLINKDELKYIVLPRNLYLDDILSNDLFTVYEISELYKKYVLTVKEDNTLKSIMNKYFMIYQKEHELEKYKKYYLDTFFKYKDISEAERMNYNSTAYTYGYVTNMPYESTVSKEFVGTLSNYLSGFEELADIDFKIVAYKNIAELKQAFSHGEIDLIFANYDITGVNVDTLKIVSPLNEEYVVLSQEPYVVNSIRSLKNLKVLTVKDTYLYTLLAKNNITIEGYNDTDELLRNIKNDSVILMDKSTYEYYKNQKFKNFKVIYEDTLTDEYQFIVRDVNKNTTFYELFNQYVSNINYKSIKYDYNTDYITNSKNELSTMIKYIIIILLITGLLIISAAAILKRKNKKNELNKEDKLKFIDVMTSLKNRNYLNYNIKKWDENVIYPQAIIIIDLNNIKYINDNYGHAEGDEVIKKAAGILIINQLENTDIVRTDGNEFLVYMVGYDEKKVIEYTRKINKELKELPHEFGATLGYSMITDDIKTIDDAINEATLSMRQAKERL